jgi:hypothetical protein
MSKWLLSLSVLMIAGAAGVTFVDRIESRLGRLETAETVPPESLVRLSRQLASLRAEQSSSEAQLARYENERSEREALASRIESLQGELAEARLVLELQAEEISGVGEMQDVLVRETLGESLEDLNQNLEQRWQDVSRTLEATAQIAERNRNSFDGLLRDLREKKESGHDVETLWGNLMGPTVQLADESTVGSGVLLASGETEGGGFRTHILTAWHVVRDILDDPTDLEQEIPTYVYGTGGKTTMHGATLVGHDARLDIAVLVLHTAVPFEHGANLPIRAHLEERRVFDAIYAVGCPLGNDPIPTRGEIADTHHNVDGESYWMISAPTYIGNSGGGIFDAQSHELLGIFSKIYTHGNLRPTVVPHMGLVTPLGTIYDWLEKAGHGELVPK